MREAAKKGRTWDMDRHGMLGKRSELCCLCNSISTSKIAFNDLSKWPFLIPPLRVFPSSQLYQRSGKHVQLTEPAAWLLESLRQIACDTILKHRNDTKPWESEFCHIVKARRCSKHCWLHSVLERPGAWHYRQTGRGVRIWQIFSKVVEFVL